MTGNIPEGFEPEPEDNAFAALVGPIFQRKDGDGVSFLFQAEEKHKNPRGVIHGGMLMTFMDNLLAHTIVHVIGDVRKATMSMSCDFIGPSYPGQRMERDAGACVMLNVVGHVPGKSTDERVRPCRPAVDKRIVDVWATRVLG